MIAFKKYIPYVLIAVAFFFGQLSVPRTDKDLIKKFAQEKKVLLTEIEYLRVSMGIRDEAGLRLREKVSKDSLWYSVQLRAKDREINQLFKHIQNVNTNRYSAADLDSAIQRLYPN